MRTREIIPLKSKLDLTLVLPGSKSITNRAFLCAALAKGKSRIYGALKSDDAQVMLDALKKLGIEVRETKDYIEISGGRFKVGKATLDLHNAGTATRFLTAVMCLRSGETIITGDKRMQERPIAHLVDGLRQLGADITYMKQEGYPPLRIKGGKLTGDVRIKGDKSSQYFSALLMLGPLLDQPLRIEVVGELVSKPYIDTTIAVMQSFGVKVKNRAYKSFEIEPQTYKAAIYEVEGDASSATYFSAINYLHGGTLKFTNLNYKKSIQGDINFTEALRQLKKPSPRTIDMEAMPDAAMTLACVAPFVKGQTKITGLSTLKIKETDRLSALEAELRKLGVNATKTKDSLTVSAGKWKKGATIETYNDHRMAMAFTVIGTRVPGIVIQDPDCTEKTYPCFWEDLEKIYLNPLKLGHKNLLLTGMRCSGKTTHGKMLANHLGRKFVDLDSEIERQEKMDIEKIVKLKGWPYFRILEQKMCSKYSATKNLVIATGGGVVLSPKNMKLLRQNSVTIFIYSDPTILCQRIKKYKGRPSLTGKKLESEIHEVWEQRKALYLKYADYVWDDTSEKALHKLDSIVR